MEKKHDDKIEGYRDGEIVGGRERRYREGGYQSMNVIYALDLLCVSLQCIHFRYE